MTSSVVFVETLLAVSTCDCEIIGLWAILRAGQKSVTLGAGAGDTLESCSDELLVHTGTSLSILTRAAWRFRYRCVGWISAE